MLNNLAIDSISWRCIARPIGGCRGNCSEVATAAIRFIGFGGNAIFRHLSGWNYRTNKYKNEHVILPLLTTMYVCVCLRVYVCVLGAVLSDL